MRNRKIVLQVSFCMFFFFSQPVVAAHPDEKPANRAQKVLCVSVVIGRSRMPAWLIPKNQLILNNVNPYSLQKFLEFEQIEKMTLKVIEEDMPLLFLLVWLNFFQSFFNAAASGLGL